MFGRGGWPVDQPPQSFFTGSAQKFNRKTGALALFFAVSDDGK
jgi:hypothetical protein